MVDEQTVEALERRLAACEAALRQSEQAQETAVRASETAVRVSETAVRASETAVRARETAEQEAMEWKKQAAFYRSVLDIDPDGVVLFDPDLVPTFLNAAGQRFYEQIHRQGAHTVLPLADLEAALLKNVFASRQPAMMEFELPGLDQSPYIEARYLPHTLEDGAVRSVLGLLRDQSNRKRVTEAQQMREQMVQAALSHVGVKIFSQDADLHYQWVYNQEAGIAGQIFPGKMDEDFYHPDDIAFLTRLKKRVLQTGRGLHEEVDLRAQGQVYTYELQIEPVKSSDYGVTGILCSMLDITERRRVSLELADLAAENHAQKELLETVFSSDPGGLAVLVGEELIHQYCNPAYRSMLPNSGADPLGRRYAEVWPQEDNFRGQWIIQRVLKSGNSFQIDRYPQEYADGVTRYYSLKLRPINWNDQPGVLIALWDVTEVEDAHLAAERAAEEARLNAQQAQEGRDILQALLDYAPEGIAIASKETGRLNYVSRYGKAMASIAWPENRPVDMETLHKVWRLVHLDGKTRARADEMPLRRAMEQGEIILNEEWRVELGNGEAPYLSCSAGPIRSSAQQIVGALVTWQDITERKMAEAALAENASRLEHSNRDLEQFAFVASHDLQEPLRKIQLFGALLMDAAAGKTQGVDTEDLLKRMINASQRMQNMINGLLSLSRVSTRGQPPSRLDLNQLVDDVLQDLEVSLAHSGGRIVVEELPALEADPLQMRQLILNLIGNALKYHQPGIPPVVRVRGEKVQMPGARNLPGVRILVEDNGIGFENEYAERIFKPFERLHGRSEYEGTGMGLAICQKIVERHHGSITAVSEPGQGATFIVTLPEKQA